MKYTVLIWAEPKNKTEEPFSANATVEANSGMLAVKKAILDIEMVREIEKQEKDNA